MNRVTWNKGSAVTLLVFVTAIAFLGAIVYLRKDHAGQIQFPSLFDLGTETGIEVNPAGKAPNVDVGPDITIKSPKSSVELKAVANDPEKGTLSYEWVKLSGGKAVIKSPKSIKTQVTGLQKGVYVFRLIVSDITGLKSADDLFVVVYSDSGTTSSGGGSQTPSHTSAAPTPTGYTTSQVAAHATQADCWITISEKVYNVSAFIKDHPGGQNAIISRCGTDVTTAFNGGVYNHSSYARTLLTSYYIGTISSGAQAPETPGQNIPPFVSVGADQTINLPTNSVLISGNASDSDGSIASYAWTKVSGGNASIESPNSVSTYITGLAQGSYVFQLSVTDNKGAPATDTVLVTVNAAPPPPPASGYTAAQVAPHNSTGNCWLIISNKVYNVTSFLSTHPGGVASIAPYCGIDGTVAFHTHGHSGGSDHGSYAYSLLPTYYVGDLSTNTPPPNVPPSADAGGDQTITLPTTQVTLTGSAVDSDGSIASYAWTKVSGTGGTITSPSSASTTVTGLSEGGYTFRLTATDNTGASGSSNAIVTVVPVPPNVSPVAVASANQSITLPIDIATLSGSGADQDGTIASYAWTKVSGTGGTITSPSSASTTVTGLSAGSYTFRLTVTDNQGATGADTTIVTVNAAAANSAPTANAGANQVITLPVDTVSFVGSGTDPDGSIASYAWTKVSGTGGVIASPSNASTDITGLTQGSYTFQLTVTDDKGATGSDTVIVTVNGTTPSNIPPTANAGVDKIITLPTSSVTLSGSGTDTDGSIASYLWTKLSGPVATITSPSLAVTTITGLIEGIYTFQLLTTDDQGATDVDTAVVTVNAAPVNNPPTANAGAPQTITIPPTTITLSGSGADQDGTIASYAWTKVSGTGGTITSPSSASTTVTGLSAGSYTFRLTVTDNQGATGASTVAITANAATYTAAEVATHNVTANCWVIVSGKVYAITSQFINNTHPGGPTAISSRCGTDITTVFTTNNNGGHKHTTNTINNILPTYWIGNLI